MLENYLLIHKNILPEYYEKVLAARHLLEDGKAKEVSQAVKMDSAYIILAAVNSFDVLSQSSDDLFSESDGQFSCVMTRSPPPCPGNPGGTGRG